MIQKLHAGKVVLPLAADLPSSARRRFKDV
jgi:hypothetical protein